MITKVELVDQNPRNEKGRVGDIIKIQFAFASNQVIHFKAFAPRPVENPNRHLVAAVAVMLLHEPCASCQTA